MTFSVTCRSAGRALSKRVSESSLKSLSTTRQFSSSGDDGKKHATPTNFATKCASLYHPSPKANRGLAPPIYFGSTYTLDDADHGARLHDKKEAAYTDDDGFVYSRWGSPTNEAAAKQIAALEGVDEAGTGGTLLFGSGMSGITSALMSVLKAGDHAVSTHFLQLGCRMPFSVPSLVVADSVLFSHLPIRYFRTLSTVGLTSFSKNSQSTGALKLTSLMELESRDRRITGRRSARIPRLFTAKLRPTPPAASLIFVEWARPWMNSMALEKTILTGLG